MQDYSLYLGKANLMKKVCRRGPQSSKIVGKKFQRDYHLGKFALVKILEGTLRCINRPVSSLLGTSLLEQEAWELIARQQIRHSVATAAMFVWSCVAKVLSHGGITITCFDVIP